MKTLRETFQNMGVDGWILSLTSLMAIMFSIVGLIWPFDVSITIQLLVGSIGLLMAAVVAQTAKRRAEIIEIKNAIGISESQLIESSREFGQHLILSVVRAERYVLDTMLNRGYPSAGEATFFAGPQAGYRKLLFERVVKGEISFKRVEIIFHEQGLEQVIHRLLLHEGSNYFIRYYKAPPTPIPIINMMSFDDQAFYLGGFYTKESPGAEQVLHIREYNLAHTLGNYWAGLWSSAIPLNEGRIIDWEELNKVALELGLTKDYFDVLVERVRNNVARDKRYARK